MQKLNVLTVTILIIIIAIFIQVNRNTGSLTENNDFNTIEIKPGEEVYTYNSYIYIYGKNGIKIIKDNKILFDDSFTLKNPYAIYSYDKIGVLDRNGKTLRVYSSEGHLYTKNNLEEIFSFTINKNGYSSIIFKTGDGYQIDVYNKEGSIVYAIKDITYDEGVPINLSISEDNKFLAVTYFKTLGIGMESNIAFYSLNKDEMFGGIIEQNQFIGIIKFLNNNNFIAISDKKISIVKVDSVKNSPEVKKIVEKPLKNIIEHVKFLDDIGFLICYGDSILNDEDTIKKNTVIIYNLSGGKIGQYIADNHITDISTNKEGIIIREGRIFNAINASGDLIWNYHSTQDIKDIILFNDINKALIIKNDQITIVKINKKLTDKQLESEEQDKGKPPDNMIEENFSKEYNKEIEIGKNNKLEIETT